MKKKSKKKTNKRIEEETDVDETTDDMAPKKGRPSSISYEAFAKMWTKSESVSQVAEALGIKTTSASAIANRLRKAGVTLKRFPRRGSQTIDVKALNRLTKSDD